MLKLSRIAETKVVHVLANIVLVFSLLPYVSPMPIKNMDVQLTANIVAILVLLFSCLVEPWRITVWKEDLIIAGLGLLMLFYVDFTVVPLDLVWLRSCGTILLSFPVYFAVRNFYRYMSPWVLCGVVLAYLLALILQVIAPSVYSATFAPLLSDVRWDVASSRGPNGLTPEPSMMGDLCVLFAVSLYFFHRDFWKRHRASACFVVISAALMLIITQSATGIVLGIVTLFLGVLVSQYSAKTKMALLAAPLVFAGLAGQALNFGQSRGGVFLSSVLDRPSAVVQDFSFIMRSAVTFLGVAGLVHRPLGTGELSLNPTLVNKVFNGGVALALWPDSAVRDSILEWITYRDRGSSAGFAIQRMGIFTLLVLGLLLSLVRGFRGQWVVRVLLLAYLLNSSLFVSAFWFVIGSCVAVGRQDRDPFNMNRALEPVGREAT
jgi:hypothetical protein